MLRRLRPRALGRRGARCSSTTRRAIAGAGSIKRTGQGASRVSAVEQQRIMRAGEHDRVGAPAAVVDEAGRDLGRDGGVVDRARRAARLGERGELAPSRPA